MRVAVARDDSPIGFSVVIPGDGATHELDGLFVEPGHMHGGVGRRLWSRTPLCGRRTQAQRAWR